jgi:hypothetical protein
MGKTMGHDALIETGTDSSQYAPRIAYLVYAHQNFEQLTRLVNALDSDNACFIIHVDKKSKTYHDFINDPLTIPFLQNPHVSFLEPRQSVRWGAYSLTEVSLRALKKALEIPSITRFRSLSGVDFPLRPTRDIEEKLLHDPDSNYLTGTASRNWRIQSRTEQFWNIELLGPNRLSHYMTYAQRLLGIKRKPPRGMTILKGSQWWSLSRDAVKYILDFLQSRPDVERFFRWSSVSDESMIQSILQTSPLWKTVVQDNQTFFRFRPNEPNPDVLDTQDLPEIMSSGKLFARKFDTRQNPQILDIVDQQRHAMNDRLEC